MFKYKFNITGEFDAMGSAMSAFVEKTDNPLTYGLEYTVDSIIWSNLPEPSFAQTAEVLISVSKSLTEARLADFKTLFPSLDIAISGA